MHYVNFDIPIGGPKFKDGKWSFGVDYWEPLAQINYFTPKSN